MNQQKGKAALKDVKDEAYDIDIDDAKKWDITIRSSSSNQSSFIGIYDYRRGRSYYYDIIYVSGLLLLTITYMIFRYVSSTYLINGTTFPYPDPKYCHNPSSSSSLLPLTFLFRSNATVPTIDEVCQRSDLWAFQLSSGIAIFFCGLLGFYTWHYTKKCHNGTIIKPTPMGRLFGSPDSYFWESDYITWINLIFQSWDFLISLYIEEHCTIIMLCHHIAAATVCYISLRYHILPYYSIYFLGCVEVSSIALVWIDLATFFPPNDQTPHYEWIISNIMGPTFVALFMYYRIILWWPISYQLLQDIMYVTRTKPNIFKTYRPHCSEWILYIFLLLNVPLGLLQLYWATIILQEVQKQFFT